LSDRAVGLTTTRSPTRDPTLPSAAVFIYPWCANYGGREYGASSCGSTSLKQCLATLWGNGGTCNLNPYYEPYPPPPTYSPPIKR